MRVQVVEPREDPFSFEVHRLAREVRRRLIRSADDDAVADEQATLPHLLRRRIDEAGIGQEEVLRQGRRGEAPD